MKKLLQVSLAGLLMITASGCSQLNQIPEAGANIPEAEPQKPGSSPSTGPNAAEMVRIGEKIFTNEAGWRQEQVSPLECRRRLCGDGNWSLYLVSTGKKTAFW